MNWLKHRTIRLIAAAAIGAGAAPALAADATKKKKAAAKDPAAAHPAAVALKEQPGAKPAAPNAPAEPTDMVRLFKGDTLDGWDGDTRLWRVENGVVIGQTTPEKQTNKNTFLIWKGGELKDFELRASFRIAGGNSGIQYRSKPRDTGVPENKWGVAGYQAEVENLAGKAGFLYHEGGPGKARGYDGNPNYLCKVGDKVEVDATGRSKVVGSLGDPAAIAAAYKPGDWNEYIIIAKGNHIRHYINGVQTVDLTDNDEANRLTSGVLALQIHQGPPMKVEFKDVRLKQDGGAAAAAK